MSASKENCPGCWSEVTKATEEIQKICDMAKLQVEQQLSKTILEKFTAIEYRSQVVEGMNYVVKIQVFDTERGFIHVRMFQALPCYGGNVNVFKVLPYMTRDDALEIF